ncbi:MAG: M48 family metalloprotease [Sphingomonadaceae bacterium]
MNIKKMVARPSVTLTCLFLASCVSGADIPGASTPITNQEASQGAQLHPDLLKEFGGAMTGPQANYVRGVGQKIAVQSGLAHAQDDFTITLLNSPVNNAFAIPGGYVYTTRQLVSLMNNEAELAAVLGHEVGHVAARHSQRRQAAAQRNSVFGALGAVLSGVLLGDSALGSTLSDGILQGSQMLTLKFSRKQETQADDLGIQYLQKAGYDPHAMATVLQSLALQNALDAQLQGRTDGRIPEWASTHPDPASRVREANAKAGTAGGVLNRDRFITSINGLMYGDDPAQGVVEGSRFIHPQLGFAFTAPQGFTIANGASAVSINGQSAKALLAAGAYSGNIETYVRNAFAQLGDSQTRLTPDSLRRTTINGLPAAIGSSRINTGSGQVDLTVIGYQFAPDKAFHFAALTQPGRSSVFSAMFSSMQRVSASDAAKIVPRRIEIITVKPGDTVSRLSGQMAYADAREARFRVLNGMSSGDSLRAGDKVKIVVRAR